MPSAYLGTDIISYLRSKYIIRQCRISYRPSDISLKHELNSVKTIIHVFLPDEVEQ